MTSANLCNLHTGKLALGVFLVLMVRRESDHKTEVRAGMRAKEEDPVDFWPAILLLLIVLLQAKLCIFQKIMVWLEQAHPADLGTMCTGRIQSKDSGRKAMLW